MFVKCFLLTSYTIEMSKHRIILSDLLYWFLVHGFSWCFEVLHCAVSCCFIAVSLLFHAVSLLFHAVSRCFTTLFHAASRCFIAVSCCLTVFRRSASRCFKVLHCSVSWCFKVLHRSVSCCFKVFHCPISSCFITMKQVQWERALSSRYRHAGGRSSGDDMDACCLLTRLNNALTAPPRSLVSVGDRRQTAISGPNVRSRRTEN